MDWPDTAERCCEQPTEYRGRINSSAFFREQDLQKAFGGWLRGSFSCPSPEKMQVKATLCPLSAQQREKLMQKIHRLTDN
jgi:hypothetical protein